VTISVNYLGKVLADTNLDASNILILERYDPLVAFILIIDLLDDDLVFRILKQCYVTSISFIVVLVFT
jgi:hypothetical protein